MRGKKIFSISIAVIWFFISLLLAAVLGGEIFSFQTVIFSDGASTALYSVVLCLAYYLFAALYFLFPIFLGAMPFLTKKSGRIKKYIRWAILLGTPVHLLVLSLLLFLWWDGPDFSLVIPAIVYIVLAINDIIWFKYILDSKKKAKKRGNA